MKGCSFSVLMMFAFTDMSKWSTDDVVEFILDRGYSADMGKLLSESKVNGRKLLGLVKNSALLASELELKPIRAQGLISDVEEYESDYKSTGCYMVVFCFYSIFFVKLY